MILMVWTFQDLRYHTNPQNPWRVLLIRLFICHTDASRWIGVKSIVELDLTPRFNDLMAASDFSTRREKDKLSTEHAESYFMLSLRSSVLFKSVYTLSTRVDSRRAQGF